MVVTEAMVRTEPMAQLLMVKLGVRLEAVMVALAVRVAWAMVVAETRERGAIIMVVSVGLVATVDLAVMLGFPVVAPEIMGAMVPVVR